MYIGIDIGGTNIKVGVVNRRGEVLARGILETEAADGPTRAFRRVRDAVTQLCGRRTAVAAGIGCAGLIDVDRGRLHSSPNLPLWSGQPLARIARRALGVPVTVENDANAAAWGEVTGGRFRGARDLVFVTMGTGIGGGIVSDGRLVSGTGGYAGEIGHMTVDPSGPRCRCGNRGCLEAIAGSYGIVRRARALVRERGSRYLGKWMKEGQRLTPLLVAQAARRGDGAARRALKEAGEAMGTGIASVVNLLNPEAVVVGGGVSPSFDLLAPHVRRVLNARAFPEPVRQVTVERSRLGNDASVIGAAMLARDRKPE